MAALGDDAPPIANLAAESQLAGELQQEIKKKLQAEYAHAGTEETLSSVLPEYIKVLVCNAKPKHQVMEDLQLFLQDSAPEFVDWLWKLLADRNPDRTHSAFGAREEGGKRRGRRERDTDGRPSREERMERRKRREARAEGASGKGIRDALTAVADERVRKPKEERRALRRQQQEEAAAAAEAEARRAERRRRKHAAQAAENDVVEVPAPVDSAVRRARRNRGKDPENAARLRDEWEQMRRREEQANAGKKAGKLRRHDTDAAVVVEAPPPRKKQHKERGAHPPVNAQDRDLLSPDDNVRDTKFTITMDRIDPQLDVPDIRHYDPEPSPADAADGGLLSGLPGGSGGSVAIASQAAAAALAAAAQMGSPGYGGGKGYYKKGKGKGKKSSASYYQPYHVPVSKGKGKGKGKSYTSHHAPGPSSLTWHAAGTEKPASPPQFRKAGKGKGAKGSGSKTFNNLVWEPGKGIVEGDADMGASPGQGKDGGNKVWVNPALKTP